MQVGEKRDIMWSNAHIHVFFITKSGVSYEDTHG